MYIKFLNGNELSNVDVKKISNNVIEIIDSNVNISGFQIIHESGDILGDYSNYTTLYRQLNNSYQLSNDGSVYKEKELEPDYIPTLEDIKKYRKEEVSNICQQTIYNGIDVDLSIGKKHFSLTVEDQLNLFGKQAQLLNSEIQQFEYHADGEPCRFFSREDMTKIIETAMSFVSYHTTYNNSLYSWIDSLNSKEEIENVNYGDEIPKQYQSEVLKNYIVLMGM